MPTPQQSAQEYLSLRVAAGDRPGRASPVLVTGTAFTIAKFPGAIQAAFLAAGYQIGDLVAGLAYAVGEGWLTLGDVYVDGAGNECQLYIIEQAGWTEAGGTAPTMAVAAQQLINVCAAINKVPSGGRFEAENLVNSFVGTVGNNTFAPEDLIPGYGYALAQGWVRPCGQNLFDPVFALTAAGVAQAA
jgi:hypothetical protein